MRKVTANRDKMPTRPCIQRAPWLGLTSLIGMVACMVASAIVVSVSHDQVVASWTIPPAVFVAVFSLTSSIASSAALGAGIAVRFWRGASSGTRISQLHYIWNHGRGFNLFPALRAGSRARAVALLVSLSYVMQFAATPLLQRSTFQTTQDRVSFESLSLDLASRIPDGWFGDVYDGELAEFKHGLFEIQQWWRSEPMVTNVEGGHTCADSTCYGHVRGAGFSYQCWTTQQTLQLDTETTNNATVFLVDTAINDNATLRLTSKYVSAVDSNCKSIIQVETCDLAAATAEYPIAIQNSTISLRRDELMTMPVTSSYASPGDAPGAPSGSGAGPLVSLVEFAITRLTDNATKTFSPEMNMSSYRGPGALADIFLASPDALPRNERCRLQWSRPTEYVLASMYDFMFRCALHAGSDISEAQNFTARRTVPTAVFQADARYLAGALAAMACGLVLVAALLWNFWLLGRNVTLSPLEIASGFGAPVLRDVIGRGGGDATIDEILAKGGKGADGSVLVAENPMVLNSSDQRLA
ncbi:hypothetical protein B0T26DRAFT_744080 [Lasiosphaeria miniovina]|uniref:Uncharacterized protein n=1 Tax=Lasiosphaeria miniovina TaxID=1954250 RepID=A0AA40DN72_9PEZI|nr:uncharacterized protein B0T26DRAFT_744080 [Lasiosphaeria miniovina]KAK0707032.1 hypothetical protein B0T26DRAFT_744080 [Lasiosphaeria miniovina]